MLEQRKADHIRINLEEDVGFDRLTAGLGHLHFLHQALPELNLVDVDLSTSFFGKTLRAPLLISSMTGGTEQAHLINRNLAIAAQETGIAMGLGSMRAALEDPSNAESFGVVRPEAPDILLFANLGAVQLNNGYTVDHCRRAIEMVEANALFLHFNALQEALQPEGNTNFAGLLDKVEAVCNKLEVPVVAKEVGWGFSQVERTQRHAGGWRRLSETGVYRPPNPSTWSAREHHTCPSLPVAGCVMDWMWPRRLRSVPGWPEWLALSSKRRWFLPMLCSKP
jgi:isopentenyl-diphosphate delta-isomerase